MNDGVKGNYRNRGKPRYSCSVLQECFNKVML